MTSRVFDDISTEADVARASRELSNSSLTTEQGSKITCAEQMRFAVERGSASIGILTIDGKYEQESWKSTQRIEVTLGQEGSGRAQVLRVKSGKCWQGDLATKSKNFSFNYIETIIK